MDDAFSPHAAHAAWCAGVGCRLRGVCRACVHVSSFRRLLSRACWEASVRRLKRQALCHACLLLQHASPFFACLLVILLI